MGVADEGERVKLLRSFCYGNRFVKAFYCDQIRTVPLMSRDITRLMFDRQLKFLLGFYALAVPTEFNEGERCVGFRKRFTNLKRFDGCLLALRKSFFGRAYAVYDKHVVTIGKPRVGRSIIRVDLNRLLKVFNALMQP